MNQRKVQESFFTEKLMNWHCYQNQRALPWKLEKNPYKIWLSEIILQQTRAEQGLPYYLHFIKKYETIQQLAHAPDEEVFRLWQGLGYYNRCKNLLATARFITHDLKGIFPNTYLELIQLKGVGSYTAAAIASFAFDLPHAVVDGNVNRVLARFFGLDTPFDTTEGKKTFQLLANKLLDRKNSAAYNQAIMDHGATICTPLSPHCTECPLQERCVAFHQNLIPYLPVKAKKIVIKKRFFHYLLLINEDKIWLHKRNSKDIWQNLFEPYLIENNCALDSKKIIKHPQYKSLKAGATANYEGTCTQKLTHQLIETKFFTLSLNKKPEIPEVSGEWVPFAALKNYAFPKTLVSFLEKKLYF